MGEGNLRAAHEVIDAVERRDLDALIALTDSDVEWRSAFAVSKGGLYVGHAGMREYVNDMTDAWDIVRLDVDQELEVGQVVIFVGRIHYRGKGSGVESEADAGYVLTFKAGKVTGFRPFRDPETALANVGLDGRA
jgi:ketosteroid isomerase-like protein